MIRPISTITFAPSPPRPKIPKIEEAAKQFEGMMIAQMLRSVREAGTGGLGTEPDNTGETMFDLADQQFSQMLANNGGLGLAKLVIKGLKDSNHQ